MMRGKVLAATAACMLLAGCDTWFGETEAPPLPGKRVSVMEIGSVLKPDPGAAGLEVVLPAPDGPVNWAQVGGTSLHAMHHVALPEQIRRVWTADIGAGTGTRQHLLAQPIVADGRVFALDAESHVAAVDAGSGALLWRVDLVPEDEDTVMGGGLAHDEGRLFATTGYGEIVAIDPANGGILWRKRVSAPLRGAPTVRGGRVVVVSVDNQTHSLAADDGRPLWTHQGVPELASMLGGSSPAIDGPVVVVPYTSGELFAMRIENGAVLWSESLAGLKRTYAMSALADIRGLPVVDRGRVYAVGNTLTAAVDLRSGRRLWEREIGSHQTPWVAGNFLFLISADNELVALEARSGAVKWVTPLQRWLDPEDRQGTVVWTGPVLASDRLIIASSHGWALSVSPYTGEVLGREKMPDGVTIAPIVAGNSLYFLTNQGQLVAYR